MGEHAVNVKKLSPRFFFSVDVDWVPGSETGLLQLYDFCEKHKLPATLFIAGRFAEEYPGVVAEGFARGHELGTHACEHGQLGKDEDEDFYSASYEDQRKWLQRSTSAVEAAVGETPVAFRAPNLRVSETTFRVLEELKYKYDSSIPSHRLSVGWSRMNDIRQFFAPRAPYYPSRKNIAVRGDSPILEIAPSSFVLPINMSALRVLGLRALKWSTGCLLKRSPILVFYSHPAEFVRPEEQELPSENPARHLTGIGPENFTVLGQYVDYVKQLGYEPTTYRGIDNELRAGH